MPPATVLARSSGRLKVTQSHIPIYDHLTPHITGSKKQSEERAALFAVRVHVIVMFITGTPLHHSCHDWSYGHTLFQGH